MKNLNYLIVILFCLLSTASIAQCDLGITHQSEQASGPSTPDGNIRLTLDKSPQGEIEIKVFRVAGKIELARVVKVSAQNEVDLKELLPGTYFIQVRWGECEKFLGGFDGILLDFKTNRK